MLALLSADPPRLVRDYLCYRRVRVLEVLVEGAT